MEDAIILDIPYDAGTQNDCDIQLPTVPPLRFGWQDTGKVCHEIWLYKIKKDARPANFVCRLFRLMLLERLRFVLAKEYSYYGDDEEVSNRCEGYD